MGFQKVSTGITGLDEILCGGLVPGRAYLIRGGPGSGKTTLGLHFLDRGVSEQETSLYVTFGESAEQIKNNGAAVGLNTEALKFLDLSPSSNFFTEIQTYDLFSPAEVEREPTTEKLIESIKTFKPQRVFLDAMTQFRYLATDEFQFRQQVLSFLRFLLESDATVLFTSEVSDSVPDDDLQFMSDGVIHLDNILEDRTIRISKFRGSNYISGLHSLRLTDRGMEIFPRLQPESHRREFTPSVTASGVPELDELLHGGLERGTVTIITGPTGVGKTTLGVQFMKEAAARGERSVIYIFEETTENLLIRSEAVNIPIHAMVERGTISLVPVEPLIFNANEFANLVRHEVETKQARIVMIDSVSGYKVAMRGENLVHNLHSICKYLQNMGVTIILINEIEEITGNFRATDVGISYIADNIVFLRYLEIDGQMRKAIGVLKKRLSDFEKTLREIEITRYGIKVGKPLTRLRKILSGTPEWDTKDDHLK